LKPATGCAGLLLLLLLVLLSLLPLLPIRANTMSVNMVPRRNASSSFGCTGTNRSARSALKLQAQ
jgi:hypothetical protein